MTAIDAEDHQATVDMIKGGKAGSVQDEEAMDLRVDDQVIMYNPTLENFGKLGDYSSYTLFMLANVTKSSHIPRHGIRLDDMHVGILIASKLWSPDQLHENWPADFEENGLTQRNRTPVGHAAKAYMPAGALDIDGNVVVNAGWYYLWDRGVHMLGGQESKVAKMHVKRSFDEHKDAFPPTMSIEVPKATFKVSGRAAIQLPAGHPDDPTLAGMPDFMFSSLKQIHKLREKWAYLGERG